MDGDWTEEHQQPAIVSIWQDEARALQSGSRWGSVDPATGATVVTFSFVEPTLSSFSYGSQSAFLQGISAFPESDRELARNALESIAAVCNIRFVEVADDASGSGAIRFGYSPLPSSMNYGGYAFLPSGNAMGGDVWIATAQSQPLWEFCRGYLILHETLHALGLLHPPAVSEVTPASDTYHTVLTERPPWVEAFPATPMVVDVAALQSLYGPSVSASGDTRYDLASAAYRSGFHVIWDSQGIDTLDASRVAGPVSLNLQPGSASHIGVDIAANFQFANHAVASTFDRTLSIADGCIIENIIGSLHADDLRGNGFDNDITGRGGNDTITGAGGTDTAVYAGPMSRYRVEHEGAVTRVVDTAGADGVDTLHDMDRLRFADGSVALHSDAHVGFAVQLLGAVFGPGAAADPATIGIALAYLDSGLGYSQAADLALGIRLGPAHTMDAVAALVSANVKDVIGQEEQVVFKDHLDPTELVLAGVEMISASVELTGIAPAAVIYLESDV